MTTTSTTVWKTEWPKQIAIWLTISSLMPLLAYFGCTMFWPAPDSEEHYRVTSRWNEELGAATDERKKQALRDQIDKSEREFSESQKAFARKVFWFAGPVGVLTLIIGTFVPVQSVGAGLMFGGIAAATEGCFESWDALGPRVRLGALLIFLLVAVILGLCRFKAPPRITYRSA